jgi:hypothetical protein
MSSLGISSMKIDSVDVGLWGNRGFVGAGGCLFRIIPE